MTETYHKEHLLDLATMLAMRATLAIQPKATFEPKGRADFDSLMEKTSAADEVTYEAATVGGVAGWWCLPPDRMDGCAVLYLHGGAYSLGSAQAYRNFAGQMATRGRTSVFVAEYRLAPEHPFPGALDDAEAAYQGLVQAGFHHLAIGGDSAGGGLALALMLQLAGGRAEDLVQPVAVFAISPWADLTLSGHSMEERAKEDPLLSRETLAEAVGQYLHSADPADPKVSPVNGNFANVPPVLLHVGEDEVLLDDSRRVAARIVDAGGNAELHVWQGMTHVFASNLLLQAAKEALDDVGRFLRQRFS